VPLNINYGKWKEWIRKRIGIERNIDRRCDNFGIGTA
jgi:hypothetical protein